MILDYPKKKNGMFILSRADMDELAARFLDEKLPGVSSRAAPVNIRYIAEEVCYLTVLHRRITRSGRVLGMLAFGDVTVPMYQGGVCRFVPVPVGTVVIEEFLSQKRYENRYRFTLAHEVSHWILHRSYYSPNGGDYRLRSRLMCRDDDVGRAFYREMSESDWLEWQADSLAASLLMPKPAFTEYARHAMRALRITADSKSCRSDTERWQRLSRIMSDRFGVSLKAAQVRMCNLGIVSRGLDFMPIRSGIDVN